MRVKKPRLEPVPEEPEYQPQEPEELPEPEQQQENQPNPPEDTPSEEDLEELEPSEDAPSENGPAKGEDAEDDSEDQQPKLHDDEVIRSHGDEGGEMPARLQALLYQHDMDDPPTYHVRKVAHLEYDEWCHTEFLRLNQMHPHARLNQNTRIWRRCQWHS